MSDDERLLRTASRGDPAALSELITRFAPEIHTFLCGMLGDEREAEDAMQETFVRVARALARYQGSPDPRPWVYGIARKVAADHAASGSLPPGPLGALRAVPTELREVLVLREVMGKDPDAIAAVLGVGFDEVPARLASAREALVSQTTT